jgi:type IV secretion system protein VirB3
MQHHEIPIHVSANRPNQMLGADYEVVITCGVCCALLAFSLQSMVGLIISVVLWVAAVSVLRKVAKADPMFRHVYLRHIRYSDSYPARSGLHTPSPSTKTHWR